MDLGRKKSCILICMYLIFMYWTSCIILLYHVIDLITASVRSVIAQSILYFINLSLALSPQ